MKILISSWLISPPITILASGSEDGWQIGRRLVGWIVKRYMDGRVTWVEGVDGRGMDVWIDWLSN